MKSIKILMAAALLASSLGVNAQIKNQKTETVKISGNCGMCETTIEKTGNIKKVSQVDWNKDTGIATLTYDSQKTNQDEILKRIALAGYDNEKFLAPDDVYSKLHGCCQYDRELKVAVSDTQSTQQTDHSAHSGQASPEKEVQTTGELSVVFSNYFALKDALVKTDPKTGAAKANDLLLAVSAVKMGNLKTDEHNIWMNVMKELSSDTKAISATQDINRQRTLFASLSKNMYDLIKASNPEEPVYYNNCPMFNDGKGANWLSKEKGIKNPYYGSQMLTCGKTVETIK